MESKTIRFVREDKDFSVIYSQKDSWDRQGLVIYANSSGLNLTVEENDECIISTAQDLNSLAETISKAWKDHLRLKLRAAQNE